MIKYPLSYFVKSPAFALAVGALIILGNAEDSSAYGLAEPLSTTDLLQSLFLSVLETVIFARIFLKELLADRNEVLAENILEQCRNYEASGNNDDFLARLFQAQSNEDRSSGAVYAPGSVLGRPEDGKTVVAVLGLAHCNGIRKILDE